MRIVSRTEWGCSRATEAWIAGRTVRPKESKTEVHVHHTAAVDNNDATPNRWSFNEATAYMRRLEVVRPDLGPLPYSMNLAIMEDGIPVLFEGRGLQVSGAHTGGHNIPGIGFGWLGNFNHPEVFLDGALDEFATYLKHLRHNHGFVRLGDTRSPNGWEVWGHRDSKATSCPGNHLYPKLEQVRFVQEAPAVFTDHEVQVLKDLVAAVDDRNSNGGFAGFAIDLIRSHRPGADPHHEHDGVEDHVHMMPPNTGPPR